MFRRRRRGGGGVGGGFEGIEGYAGVAIGDVDEVGTWRPAATLTFISPRPRSWSSAARLTMASTSSGGEALQGEYAAAGEQRSNDLEGRDFRWWRL